MQDEYTQTQDIYRHALTTYLRASIITYADVSLHFAVNWIKDGKFMNKDLTL